MREINFIFCICGLFLLGSIIMHWAALWPFILAMITGLYNGLGIIITVVAAYVFIMILKIVAFICQRTIR